MIVNTVADDVMNCAAAGVDATTITGVERSSSDLSMITVRWMQSDSVADIWIYSSMPLNDVCYCYVTLTQTEELPV